jgi:hypothetical protein
MTDRSTAELEARLSAAFGRQTLPPAPVSVYRQLERVAEVAPAGRSSAPRRWKLGLVASIAVAGLTTWALAGVVLLGSHPSTGGLPPPPPTVVLPVYRGGVPPANDAITGRLSSNVDCVWIEALDGSGSVLPLWPPGYTYELGALDAPDGHNLVIAHEILALEGKKVLRTDVGALARWLERPLPAACQQYDVFVVTRVTVPIQ